jgi:hypothetical protein
VGLLLGYLFAAVIIATWTAWLADRRGRHFWVYFTFTVVFPISAVASVPYLLLARGASDERPDANVGPPST